MVQTIVNLGEFEDRVLGVVKGKYGLKNKSQAVNFVIVKFQERFLEPNLRPEYKKKLSMIKKEKGTRYKTFEELKKEIENA